jgi:hypothetical protein
MASLPEGWTDDMTICLPPGRRVEEFVEFVVQQALAGQADADTESELVRVFELSPEEAALVRDRVFGGIVRAATGNLANRPEATKDPFAFACFLRATREPGIISAVYPQLGSAMRRAWWQFWRKR